MRTFFLFILFSWLIMLIYFQVLRKPCIPGIDPSLSWCVTRYWIQFPGIFVRIFVSIFLGDFSL